jgi:2-dehydropantoate 2-reductase
MDEIGGVKPLPVLIVGTGALATLFAWRLARAGHRPTMLGSWQPGINALREMGARLVDSWGQEDAVAVQVIEDSREPREVRHALVLVKSWQTARVAEQLAECLSPEGLVVTLQNGLGNYEILAQVLGADRVALGSTTTGATLLGPGLVKAGGEGTVSIQTHAWLGPLEAALRSSGFKVDVVRDAKSLVWAKLVINSAINPLTALLRIPNGELLNRPAARVLMHALADETAAVALAEHVNLNIDDPAAFVEDVARKTAANYSSMLQDIRRSAPTEIEAICGAVVRAGQRDGIATPVNDACWKLVRALAEGAEAVKADAEMKSA